MFYALPGNEVVEYQLDEDGNRIQETYTDSDGNVYEIDLETGQTFTTYYPPVEFESNIALSGGEAEAQEFGLSVADYNAVIVAEVGRFPIVNSTLIWFESEVAYKDKLHTIVDEKSADYMVLKVSPSLNTVRYVLRAVVK
jgi:hypothetical protein